MRTRPCIIAAALVAVSIQLASATEVTFDNKTKVFSEADLARAFDEFRAVCLPLGGAYWSDVESVRVQAFDEYADHRLAKGWKATGHLAITMSENPSRMPAFNDEIGVMAGQTLHYDLGGSKTAGFFASKRVSQLVCGLKVKEDGTDAFMPAPELKFLAR